MTWASGLLLPLLLSAWCHSWQIQHPRSWGFLPVTFKTVDSLALSISSSTPSQPPTHKVALWTLSPTVAPIPKSWFHTSHLCPPPWSLQHLSSKEWGHWPSLQSPFYYLVPVCVPFFPLLLSLSSFYFKVNTNIIALKTTNIYNLPLPLPFLSRKIEHETHGSPSLRLFLRSWFKKKSQYWTHFTCMTVEFTWALWSQVVLHSYERFTFLFSEMTPTSPLCKSPVLFPFS